MFRHVLVPTDGSPLSTVAVGHAAILARSIGAKLTFFYASPDLESSIYGDAELLRNMGHELIAEATERQVERILKHAQDVAAAEGVPAASYSTSSNEAYEAIIAAAKTLGCDLILMASHGRSGIKGFLLGSQTQKVLTHSKIPVLVYR